MVKTMLSTKNVIVILVLAIASAAVFVGYNFELFQGLYDIIFDFKHA